MTDNTFNLTAIKNKVQRYFKTGGAHFIKVGIHEKGGNFEVSGFSSNEVIAKIDGYAKELSNARYSMLIVEY